ncbi:MAG: NAD-dependent epimerase/dehydratase family protein [Firmicutes bacterium]|nr:NAD-dependent epimerase/dehydratase family protein [Bacillota bacterium]
MRKILVTGGTVFVSKYIAEYFAQLGEEVYVLNRGTHQQLENVKLIEADRHKLGDVLKGYIFDAVLDVTAYTGEDVSMLLDALGGFKDYILISSSAVYPEHEKQPFVETADVGQNKFWGQYGLGKIEAEQILLQQVPSAYVFRPPYLYGPMNNVYREAFVFECAEKNRKFYLPKDGTMQLQFFHVRDLCRCVESVLEKHPKHHIFNVGNADTISVRDWAAMCYRAVGAEVEYAEVYSETDFRKFFSFYDYEYKLDTTAQNDLLKDTIAMEEGLKEAYTWYQNNKECVNRKDYIEYIDENLQLALEASC